MVFFFFFTTNFVVIYAVYSLQHPLTSNPTNEIWCYVILAFVWSIAVNMGEITNVIATFGMWIIFSLVLMGRCWWHTKNKMAFPDNCLNCEGSNSTWTVFWTGFSCSCPLLFVSGCWLLYGCEKTHTMLVVKLMCYTDVRIGTGLWLGSVL